MSPVGHLIQGFKYPLYSDGVHRSVGRAPIPMGIDSARVDIRSVDSVPIILKGVLGPLILLRDGGIVGAPFGKNLSHISTPRKKSIM